MQAIVFIDRFLFRFYFDFPFPLSPFLSFRHFVLPLHLWIFIWTLCCISLVKILYFQQIRNVCTMFFDVCYWNQVFITVQNLCSSAQSHLYYSIHCGLDLDSPLKVYRSNFYIYFFVFSSFFGEIFYIKMNVSDVKMKCLLSFDMEQTVNDTETEKKNHKKSKFQLSNGFFNTLIHY